jgi:hypothetical protein
MRPRHEGGTRRLNRGAVPEKLFSERTANYCDFKLGNSSLPTISRVKAFSRAAALGMTIAA